MVNSDLIVFDVNNEHFVPITVYSNDSTHLLEYSKAYIEHFCQGNKSELQEYGLVFLYE